MTIPALLSRLKESGIGIQPVGDRLKINTPKGSKLPADLLTQLKERKQEILQFLRKVRRGVEYRSIEPAEVKEYYELSPAQKPLYFIQRMAPGSTAYNIPVIIPLDPGMDREKLESIFKCLISRHESLRTSFPVVGDRPVQRIHDEVEFGIEKGTGENLLPADFVRPFDLTRAPLLRAGFIRTGENRRLLMVDMHHIITDGTSLEILTAEFKGLYGHETPGPLPIQYKDYSGWRNSEKRKAAVRQQEEYWLGVFAEEPPAADLPYDYPAPLTRDFSGGRVGFRLEEDGVKGLKAIAGAFAATPYMVLLAIFNILLAKISGQEDIVVGTPLAARRHIRLKNIMGMFVNTLAMRNYPGRDRSFSSFLTEVKKNTLNAYENQEYPFEELVDRMGIERDAGRNPVFSVMFSLQERENDPGDVSSRDKKDRGEYMPRSAKFDLDLSAVHHRGKGEEETFSFHFDYCTRLFKAGTIHRLIAYFKKIAAVVAVDPGIRIAGIEIVSESEKRKILEDFNDTAAEYPQNKTIHELFAEQAARMPDGAAVAGSWRLAVGKKERIEEPVQLTYRELNKRSDWLARSLRERGVQPDGIVGIMMERRVEMVIGIMGILKAGGAYLPIDPGYPEERKRYMLTDSGAKILLTNLPEGHLIHQSSFINHHSGNLAYVIYTSGSTGKPKGVMVEHRSVVNLVSGLEKNIYCRYSRSLNVCLVAPYVFDASVQQIFAALLLGHCLYIVPGDTRIDGFKLGEFYQRYAIDISDGTPTHIRLLWECPAGSRKKTGLSVTHFIIGGEVLPRKTVENFFNVLATGDVRITNVYGPTECCVDCTSYQITAANIRNHMNLPIGGPLPEQQVYILDPAGHLQPIGIPGELFIGGAGVSRGYLNNPELTAERFILAPASSSSSSSSWGLRLAAGGCRLYRTGDLARWLADGNIEFLGRIDHQVKIRGFRIELGEIENRLADHKDIKEAVVIAGERKDGDKYLCAYIVSGNSDIADGLREYLQRLLPDYMVPSFFVFLEELPVTPHGKVNRKALPPPGAAAVPGGHDRVPRDKIEKKLAAIWSEILEIETDVIRIDDNFFHRGGHSLKAALLAAKLHRELNVKLPLTQIFTSPRFKDLAEYIKGRVKEVHVPIEPVEEKEYYPLSSAQKRLYVLHRLASGSTYYNIPFVIELQGAVDREKLEAAFRNLVSRHESLRTSFEMIAEEPVQRIHNGFDFSIGRYEMDEVEAEDIITGFTRPFDLSKAPLLRVNLVHAGTPAGSLRRVLFIDMHHIITDAASQDILKREFNALYGGERLPELRLQYKDYSGWQNVREQGEAFKEQEAFWLKEFPPGDDLPVSNLPGDYPRPLVQRFEGNLVNFALDTGETGILKTIARENDVTLFMCLLAVFNVLFARLSGQEDIILGAPIAVRRHADLQDAVGMFLNTLPMRNYPAAAKPFNRFLEEVKKHTLEAYENQEYPFENLVDHLAVNRDTSRNPLFDVMLVLINQAEYHADIQGMPVQPPYRHLKRTSRFDMSIVAVDMGENLYVGLEYSTNLFSPGTIETYITYFKNIIRQLGVDARQKIADIEYITREEKEAILGFSSGVSEVPVVDLTIHGMFEERAARVPDRTALVFKDRHLGYGELNRRSNRLARLLGEKGVGTGAVVGVMMERSLEMVTAILAVVKAGGAYMPIDPAYPVERILAMLDDSSVFLLLTAGNLLDRFSIMALKNMRAGGETLTVTPPRPQIKNFDGLPLPDRTLIDYRKYHRYIGEAPAKNTITLQATRGCPYGCLYCHKIWPKTHVARGAENVFREISYAYDAGIRRFVFIDDIFNLHRENAERLLETIIKSRMDIRLFFPNGFRADILSRDFIDLMMAAGTVNLDVALESASPRIQRLIKKNLNLEKFRENVRYITETYPGVILEMEMMHGFPTETEEEALMTLEFLKELKWVHFPNLHILKIFPNTDMCRFAVESGIPGELIERSADLAFHELPDTLPFAKSFTRRFQARFMGEYFLSKERLLHVLPYQTRILTEDELVQKYDSYLSSTVECFDDIIRYAGIAREELGEIELKQEEDGAPDFNREIGKYFPLKRPAKDAFRVLLLDLSQLFSEEHEHMLHHQVEEPLGLLYLMSYLNETFKERIEGKVFKSRIDFDGYDELKKIIFDFSPDLIGIRTLSFYKDFFHKAVLMIRHWGIKAPIVAGGPYATSDFSLVLRDADVDLVVLGEGEFTLAHLVEKMIENGKMLPGREVLHEIPGIAFGGGMGKTPAKRNTREILLMDELPAAHLEKYPGGNLRRTGHPGDLLYVIYTSGSTGKPRGAVLEHRNLVNLIRCQYKYTNIDFTRVLQFTTISFDVSAQEIFSTLLAGGRLCLIDKQTQGDIPGLFAAIEKENVVTLFLPASFLKFVTNEEDFARRIPVGVRHIVTAGEQAIVNNPFKEYLCKNRVFFHNHYGPAETHVVTTLTIDPGGDIPGLPAIGRPVVNTVIYIVDSGMHLVPLGVAGQLVIGGSQLGRGYLNRPELTAEKFVLAPASSTSSSSSWGLRLAACGCRLYKTGDLARWLRDGNIEFLGRMDFQVKIRGFRVELGEIETRLLNHGEIKECVVLARPGERGGNYLCAYIVSGREFAASELRDYLSKGLPDYMVPSYFVFLDRIPLTPNRKIDRGALPAPGAGTGKDYAAPRTENEKRLAALWSQVLNIDINNIGIEDNFFELGGHSLLATILAARIHKEFQVKLALVEVFQSPTIKGLSRHLQGAGEDKFIAVEPVEKKEYYILSPAQKRLYILQQMDGNSTAYNMPEVIPFAEVPGAGKLEDIFKRLIVRHESLRTSFHMIDGHPVQRIHDSVEFKMQYYELAAKRHKKTNTISNEENLAEVFWGVQGGDFTKKPPWPPEAIINHFVRPFDLSRAPLLRAGLLEPEKGRGILWLDMHHIVCDGISREVVRNDFMLFAGGSAPLPLRIQYKDFSQWLHGGGVAEAIKQQEVYWLKQFGGEIPAPDLPTDYARPMVKSFAGDTVPFEIPAPQTRILKDFALENGSTLYMVLLGAFNILLAKLGGREDIVVGTPVGGRRHADLDKIMGMFVNTLALRNHPAGGKTVTGFLHEVKERTLNAFENQDYPFEDLVEKVAVNRDTGRNPLFEVTFSLSTIAAASPAVTPGETSETARQNSGITVRLPYDYENKTAKFDLTLVGMERDGKLLFSLNYCTELFKKETIQRFIAYFKKIVSFIINEPAAKLCRVEIIPAEEKKQLLEDFNRTDAGYPADKSLHWLFADQAAGTPDGVALLGSEKEEQTTLTYGELNRRSDRLAHVLKEKGVLPDNIVGIMMKRSLDMIIGILGILKAGAAYLPMDADYPQERIDYMLKDSNAKILLTDLPDGRYIHHSSNQFIKHHPGNIAYVIYTSGSTGRPKGVLIPHRGVVNMVRSHRRVFKEHAGSFISQVASPAFDAMAFEVWPCLLAGARLCIVDDETRMEPRRLKEWLIRHQVTISFQPTGIALELLDEPWPQSGVALKVLRTAGDRLTRYPARSYPFRFYNLYGPTETTVWSTWTEVEAKTGSGYPPIGKPIDNHRVYILSPDFEPRPIGAAGELCIAGAGLARGYLNRPELTNEKFCLRRPGGRFLKKLPPWTPRKNFSLDDCVYRTGDLGRWLPDGNIEFLGRIDHQVKIRGYRIELGEIQSRLEAHEGIKEAIVIDRETEPGEKHLCAYIIPESRSAGPALFLKTHELREFLSRSLPDYMIPAYFTVIDKIPLTPNGKIDRNALPVPGIDGPAENYVPPRNKVEKKLVAVWAETLGIKKEMIGIDADFFQLGGHSLKAVAAVSGIRKEFNMDVPLLELFRSPFIKSLAEFIRKAGANPMTGPVTPGDDHLVLLKKTPGKAGDFFFIHDGTGEVDGYVECCNHLTGEFNSWGIRAPAIENDTPQNLSIEEIARNYIHKMKSLQSRGPYFIAGWSIGGTIAFEMVLQLEQMGEKTGFLALIDTPPPGKLENRSHRRRVRPKVPGYCLNMVLTLNKARERYIPGGKIDTQVHFFKAGKEKRAAAVEKWNLYCRQPIRLYEIPGDHFSIMKMPEAATLAGLLDTVMRQRDPGPGGPGKEEEYCLE